MIELTYEQTLELMGRVVAEKGEDYVYVQPTRNVDGQVAHLDCAYFNNDGTPSCLVGHVFAAAGATIDDVAAYNADSMVETLVTKGILQADDRTVEMLRLAQNLQDSGAPWGRAFKEAKGRWQE